MSATTATTSTVTVTPKRPSRESSPSGGLDALFADAGYTGSAVSTGVTKPTESVEPTKPVKPVEPVEPVETTKTTTHPEFESARLPTKQALFVTTGCAVPEFDLSKPLDLADIEEIVLAFWLIALKQALLLENTGRKDHPYLGDHIADISKLYGFMTDGGSCQAVIDYFRFKVHTKSKVPLGKASARTLNKIVSAFVSFLANRLNKISYAHTSNTIITVRTGKTGGQRDKTVTTPGAALSKKARRKFDANQRARASMRDAEAGTIRVNSRELGRMCEVVVRRYDLSLAEKAGMIRGTYKACKEIAHVVLDLADPLCVLKETTEQHMKERAKRRNTRRVE